MMYIVFTSFQPSQIKDPRLSSGQVRGLVPATTRGNAVISRSISARSRLFVVGFSEESRAKGSELVSIVDGWAGLLPCWRKELSWAWHGRLLENRDTCAFIVRVS
jgi:hypothetical protein